MHAANLAQTRTPHHAPTRSPSPAPIEIEPGSRDDLARLSRFHYCAGAPATVDLVLRARLAGSPAEIAGVLAVSRPALNASWRDAAWPGTFSSADPVRNARAINAHLRCISRIIVEPRFRGLSIARRLIEAYLASPLTPLTESIATMGAFCPLFERAGMRRIEIPPAQRDIRLRSILAEHAATVRDLIVAAPLPPPVERALRTWARDARATRALADGDAQELAWLAARRLIRPRAVFIHGELEPGAPAPNWPVHGLTDVNETPIATTGSRADD